MQIEIKNRFTDEIIISGKYESIKECLEKNKANLRGADLREADLREADLRGADLRGADLRGADLWEADLREADLRGADLWEADLWGADLRGADLRGADLRGADLREADLRGADLRGADLRGADLREADFREADLREANINISHMLISNSVQTILTIINWGELSDEMTLEMMRHDAEACGINKMTIWAKGGSCPFNNSIRDYKFQEKKELWIPGEPKLRGIKLLKALCEEKGFKFE